MSGLVPAHPGQLGGTVDGPDRHQDQRDQHHAALADDDENRRKRKQYAVSGEIDGTELPDHLLDRQRLVQGYDRAREGIADDEDDHAGDEEGGEPYERGGGIKAQDLGLAGYVQHDGGQAQRKGDLGQVEKDLDKRLAGNDLADQDDGDGNTNGRDRWGDQQQRHHERPAGGYLPVFFEAQPAQGPHLGKKAAGGEKGEDFGARAEQALSPGRPRVVLDAAQGAEDHEADKDIDRNYLPFCHGGGAWAGRAGIGSPSPAMLTSGTLEPVRKGAPLERSAQNGDGATDQRQSEGRIDYALRPRGLLLV